MKSLLDHPSLVAVLTFFVMWAAARISAHLFAGMRDLEQEERDDFGFVTGATLTLLGLIIGFSFSMAIGRYDQRRNYEEEEANAIGTEYVRAQLLPPADAEKIQGMMKTYLQQRILFYVSRDGAELKQIDAQTAKLQNEMWLAVKTAATSQQTPVVALAVAGMNDVLNRQGYTQAAWWNRIPVAAWVLMVLLAIACNVMLGFRLPPRKVAKLNAACSSASAGHFVSSIG